MVIGQWSLGGCELASEPFEKSAVYRLAESVADRVWVIVVGWNGLARDTVGKQLIRAADSIGANIAEGCGRHGYQDDRRFVKYAQGSRCETKHWLRRAFQRKLLTAEQIATVKPFWPNLVPASTPTFDPSAALAPTNNPPLKRQVTNDQ
jgi:four helix bundle protein